MMLEKGWSGFVGNVMKAIFYFLSSLINNCIVNAAF